MTKNLGRLDRILRIVLAAVVGYLFYTNAITGTLGIVLLIVAGVLGLTAIIGVCPLYKIVGIKTCRRA